MDWLVKLIYISFFFYAVTAQSWDDPFISDPNNEFVSFTPQSNYFEIKMDEEQEQLSIGILEYTGSKDNIAISDAPANMGLQAQCSGTEKCKLVVMNKMDFEANLDASYRVTVRIGAESKDLLIAVRNIDDNLSYMQLDNTNGCKVKEEWEGDVTQCKYTLSDADGFLQAPTFKVLAEDGNDFGQIFHFRINKPVTGTDKSVGVILKVNENVDLQYDERSLYIFNVLISEDTPSENIFRALIEIEDIPNKPPIWTEIRSLYQIKEEEETEIQITAEDGDITIKAEINYKIDEIDEMWKQYIIIEDPKFGKIKILKINRDVPYFDQNSGIIFTVAAYEMLDINEAISAKITLIIEDIDDEIPEITVEGGSVDNLFRICESRNNPIANLKLSVHDKDLGENARYTVKLEDSIYSKAFKLVPESGYQKLDFVLTIENSKLLDFEDDDWKTFSLNIQSQAIQGEKKDAKKIIFELINWNDEAPIFSDMGLEPEVDETLKQGLTVTTIKATDRDGDMIKYSLPRGMLTILEITDDGVIKTKVNNVFDYERQETLLLYVTATDKFDGDEEGCNPLGTSPSENSVTAVVTVTINDINDETPIINAILIEDIIIMENLEDGTPVDLKSNVIEATDADKDNILKFEIDWDNSRATVNGARLIPENFEKHVKEFLKIETDLTSEPGKAFPIFNTNEKYSENPGHSPDYEKFDTVVLKLKVIDTMQTEEFAKNYATVDITILIGDKNDNSPIFDPKFMKDRIVIENAAHGITLDRVLAEDADGDLYNTVTYSIFEEDGTTSAKQIAIDEKTGELTVMNNNPQTDNINCDPDIEFLTYEIKASDPEGLSARAKIKINIIDVNDETPKFDKTNLIIDIDEELPEGSEVQIKISATDQDRDAPNNVIVYRISASDVSIHFNIDPDLGKITINSVIDRETLLNNPIVLNIIAMDNGGSSGLSDTASITININDINDNPPVIITVELSTNENIGLGPNEHIGGIRVEDLDESGTVNCEVTLEIIQVTSPNGKPMKDYFIISNSVQDGQITTFTLTALKSLKDFHGEIKIDLKATDKGDQTQGSEPHELTLILKVGKYNFIKPEITFPKINSIYTLNLVNEGVLAELVQGGFLDPITANDQQGDKYSVQLKLLDPSSTQANEIEHEFVRFSSANTAISPSLMYIKKKPEANIHYEVLIKAENIDASPLEPSEMKTVFVFIDPKDQPKFIDNIAEKSISENDPDATIDSLPKASFGEGINLPVFYHIQNLLSVPFRIVKQDPEDGNYALTIDTTNNPNGLDREEEKQYIIKIIATRTIDPPSGDPDPKSLLTVTIHIDDRNDNLPKFEQMQYYKALVNTLSHGAEVFRLKAEDLDDTDVISYNIPKAEWHGEGSVVNDPFVTGITVDDDQCAIKLNFGVTTVMEGYFDLTITATDSLDGIHHVGETKAQVYIVSELHRMDFKFLNPIDEVIPLKSEIVEILDKVFEYESVAERINIETEDDVELTVVSVYFLDASEQQPVLKTVIIDKASVVTVISSLTGQFNSIGLALKSFVDNLIFPEDLSEYYKTWLIGVAAVMGVLITFIIIAFTFKYLRMKNQITRLTGRKFGSIDSGLNRKVAPNTNNYTFDGANPMFVSNNKQPEMPDTASVSSGDSELYGVENNPVFSNNVEKY